MKPTYFYGFQAPDISGFTLKLAYFRIFKAAFISWFHLATGLFYTTPGIRVVSGQPDWHSFLYISNIMGYNPKKN